MNTFALKAVEWLTRALSLVRGLKRRLSRRLVKVKGYLEDLVKLEQEAGAETEAWRKIESGATNSTVVTLTAEEAHYLHEFKGLWNRYFKKPLHVLSELVDEALDDDDDADSDAD